MQFWSITGRFLLVKTKGERKKKKNNAGGWMGPLEGGSELLIDVAWASGCDNINP